MSSVEVSLTPGSEIEGYRVERVEPLPWLQGTYVELTHPKTGARHIHLAVPDDNNAFVVVLPTPPQDSTGVAHILEHLVLSGSERYPVKDVFFSMNPRSLRTYMNASTSADSTSYYFATRNPKDYSNLLSIYLDAVFFPRLAELSFKQEGHRLEFADGTDPSSGLLYKGVVFNEMKGAMANPMVILFRTTGRALFPDLTYANNSGGDPRRIPELTWEDLRAFHARHYHPSNAYFYTYGNLPLGPTLKQISELALHRFEATEPGVRIPDQTPFDSPGQLVERYPLENPEEAETGCQVLVAWATVPAGSSFEVLGFEVLERVLLANAASPLRKALVKSGLGSALNDLSGFMSHAKQGVFAAGLKGVRESDAQAVEELILSELEDLAASGLDPEAVDAAIHRLEIERREVSNAGMPYGLRVFDRFEGAYLHGGDPYRALMFDQDLARLKGELEAGPYFENLIRRWLLDNPHRTRVVLAPDTELVRLAEEEERTRLAEIERSLSEGEVTAIVEQSRALADLQDAPQDLSVLPTLELEDIPMTFEDVDHSIETIDGTRVGFFPQPTNGLCYVDLRFDFSRLDTELLGLLAPFAFAATRSGTDRDDYLGLAARIERHTGGIGSAPALRIPLEGERIRRSLAVSGKYLERNQDEFFAILTDILTTLRFTPSRLAELVAQQKGRLEPRILQAGHGYAHKLALSVLGDYGAIEEQTGGLHVIRVLRDLAARDSLQPVIEDLDRIRQALLRSGPGLQICITAEESALPGIRSRVGELIAALPEPAEGSPAGAPARPGRFQARTISVPVAYNAKVREAVGYTHPDAPALMVLANYLDDKYLLREIREKGGAYGAMASFGRESGYFNLLSYRDPHIERTLQVWDTLPAVMDSVDISGHDLKEAILASCGTVDPLLSPDTKGRSRFFDDLAGYTIERKAAFKQGLLRVQADDLRRVAAEYLTRGEYALATISNQDKIAEANRNLGDIFEVAPV